VNSSPEDGTSSSCPPSTPSLGTRTTPTLRATHRKNLRLSLETSLRRLRTDYIDLYWVHMWDRHWPTPAQVAIAWTRSRSPAVIPVIGARSLDQLLDNLGAASLELPADAITSLDSATAVDLGFPAAFIRDNTPWVFGAAALQEADD
jgi:aryl-alcohol dehydrogenase-like predicted oxidoreductase